MTRPLTRPLTLATLTLALALPVTAAAQDTYVSVSGGLSFASDSDNEGVFTDLFVTGEGSDALPAGTELAAGTDVGWTTDFDTGYTLQAAIGKRFASGFRGELEVAYDRTNVETHVGVTAAGGTDITGQDAALLTGADDGLGVTVGQVVADGQGDVSSLGVYANAYFDFVNNSAITPYVGAGIGFSKTYVDYSPSAVVIIDDTDSGLGWQVMGGASYAISPNADLFAGARYRTQSDVEVDATLFPAEFEIENDRILAEVGVRFRFN